MKTVNWVLEDWNTGKKTRRILDRNIDIPAPHGTVCTRGINQRGGGRTTNRRVTRKGVPVPVHMLCRQFCDNCRLSVN